ncbi:hypothetical protein M5D96_005189 [Drosophila gunungcola]|uniref:Uncharacterized protein n=1 Tax=Drosophila gunungcola TaxID=103775 RepID=A0A9Q0BTR5_9MUSC|nr:hypothetical protein M5D96_005189 [Drosophila gunungcola]
MLRLMPIRLIWNRTTAMCQPSLAVLISLVPISPTTMLQTTLILRSSWAASSMRQKCAI